MVKIEQNDDFKMSEQEWLDIFSDNISAMIEESGMTQSEVAEATGLSEPTISSYVRGRKIPGLKALINLAHTFGCSIDELVDYGEDIE